MTKHDTCTLPTSVAVEDAARGCAENECYVCGGSIERKQHVLVGPTYTDRVTEYGITVPNPFKVF